MKVRHWVWPVATTMLAIWAVVSIVWIAGEQSRTYRVLQQHLADQLGVRIDNYPYPAGFPVGYFYETLEVGMSVKEVHEILKGYSRVLRCGSYAEVYYFYTTNDDTATRFRVFYDEQMLLSESHGEDDDSRTIFTDGCREGLFEES